MKEIIVKGFTIIESSTVEACPRCGCGDYKERDTMIHYPIRECAKCGASYSLIDNDRFTLDKSVGGSIRVSSC